MVAIVFTSAGLTAAHILPAAFVAATLPLLLLIPAILLTACPALVAFFTAATALTLTLILSLSLALALILAASSALIATGSLAPVPIAFGFSTFRVALLVLIGHVSPKC